MGILTDFVIADRSEAQWVGEASVPSQEYPGIDAKGMDQVKMGTLYSILTRTDYDPCFMINDQSFVYSASNDGPWVQVVPDDMVERLADMTEAEIPMIGEAWGKTEEFEPQHGGWTQDDVVAFLREMASLSRRALAENKSLFMWTSL